MDARATRIYRKMLIAAADAIAALVPAKDLGPDRIIPRVFDLRTGPAVAAAVANAAVALGVAREDIDPQYIGERTKHLVYEGESALVDHAVISERRTLGDEALELHRRYRGAIEVMSKIPLKDEHTLLVIAPPGVALEDAAAPRCFEIERRLRLETGIPIFHDDQHGTAVVVLAGLLNALRLTGREIGRVTVTINGAGAAGISVTKLLMMAGVADV